MRSMHPPLFLHNKIATQLHRFISTSSFADLEILHRRSQDSRFDETKSKEITLEFYLKEKSRKLGKL